MATTNSARLSGLRAAFGQPRVRLGDPRGLGYFFATFTKIGLGQVPAVLAVLVAATACAFLAEAVVPDPPARSLATRGPTA
jgi:hypothetical protein